MRINRKKANAISNRDDDDVDDDDGDTTMHHREDDQYAATLHIKQINSIYKYVTPCVSYIMLLSLLTEIILLSMVSLLSFPFFNFSFVFFFFALDDGDDTPANTCDIHTAFYIYVIAVRTKMNGSKRRLADYKCGPVLMSAASCILNAHPMRMR